jgi:hypothetical protein
MFRRSSNVILALSLSLACLPGCKKKPVAAQESAEDGESPLRALVAETLAPASFAVVGDVVRGDRRAIVVWPGMEDGEPSSLVAFAFARAGGKWSPVSDRLALPKRGGAQVLSDALGGADEQRILRDCGLADDALAAHLQQHAKAFSEAVAASDTSAASAAYEQMARAFAWQHVATSSLLLDLLLTPAPKTWYCGPKGCTLETDWEGRRRLQTFTLEVCGEGKVIGEAIAAEP